MLNGRRPGNDCPLAPASQPPAFYTALAATPARLPDLHRDRQRFGAELASSFNGQTGALETLPPSRYRSLKADGRSTPTSLNRTTRGVVGKAPLLQQSNQRRTAAGP